VYATAATLTVNPGVIEINGTVYSRTASSTTMNLATAGHWIASTSEPANGWVYVYAYNDSGTSWDVKLWTQPPLYYNCNVSNTTGILRYRDSSDVWYRCIGAVRNISSDILKFYQLGDAVYYPAPPQALDNGTQTTWTDLDLSTWVPPFSQLVYIWSFIVATALFYRTNGESTTYPRAYNSNTHPQLWIPTDSSQIIEQKQTATAGDLDVYVLGYSMGGIR
jgi:hypothetical protein